MTALDRRRFLELSGLTGAAGLALPGAAWSSQSSAAAAASRDDQRIVMSGDGLSLTPPQYARLLARLTEEGGGVAPDAYILGGVVEELEAAFARVLGKERAVFLPTGTLANQLAIRVLAGGTGRAIVQEESHIYQDSGDCVQTLSQITLMPLAAGRATFTGEEVEQTIARTRTGRVARPVSVMSVESPVRRRLGETFDTAELAKVTTLARAQGIRLHLDGARLFIEAAYAGRPVASYAEPFDTVYVSLYKYFNAASGAVLAGPRALLDDLFHTRRMFGGGLYHAWPFAAVALHYLPGFEERFARAIRVSEEFRRELARVEGLTVEPIAGGTNLFRLRVARDAPGLRARLAEHGVLLPAPSADGVFLLAVNETWNRTTGSDLTEAFTGAFT
jgi:threonine aldolase